MVRFDRADLRQRDEQVEHLRAGEVAGADGEDLLETRVLDGYTTAVPGSIYQTTDCTFTVQG